MCLAEGLRPSFAQDDKATHELYKYLRQRAAAGGDPQRTALADGKFPSLAAAFQIRRGRLRDLRPMLEAYLVTDVKEETLAAKLALPPETIPAYRLAFFDLQTLGKAPLPVIFRVIGIGGAATSNLDQCGLLKLIGLKLGAAGLDAYFFGTQGNDTAFKSGDLGAWLSHACRIEAAAKLMITISNLHPDDSKTLPRAAGSPATLVAGRAEIGSRPDSARKRISTPCCWNCPGSTARSPRRPLPTRRWGSATN